LAIIDRFALSALLAAAALAGYHHHAVYLLAFGFAALGLWPPQGPSKLTRV
jgi:hypothetical protein